jgi:hypothetical protein
MANEAVINFEKKSAQAPPNDGDDETSDGKTESSEDDDNEDDFAELINERRTAEGPTLFPGSSLLWNKNHGQSWSRDPEDFAWLIEIDLREGW